MVLTNLEDIFDDNVTKVENQYCMVLGVVDLFIMHSFQIQIINKCIHLSLPFATINKFRDCGTFDVICGFSL